MARVIVTVAALLLLATVPAAAQPAGQSNDKTLVVTSCPWTVPSDFSRLNKVEAIGGGAGGGGGVAGGTNGRAGGGGGGGGEYRRINGFDPGTSASISCTIGSGGSGGSTGTSPAAGTACGDTTFNPPDLVAQGGR